MREETCMTSLALMRAEVSAIQPKKNNSLNTLKKIVMQTVKLKKKKFVEYSDKNIMQAKK